MGVVYGIAALCALLAPFVERGVFVSYVMVGGATVLLTVILAVMAFKQTIEKSSGEKRARGGGPASDRPVV